MNDEHSYQHLYNANICEYSYEDLFENRYVYEHFYQYSYENFETFTLMKKTLNSAV